MCLYENLLLLLLLLLVAVVSLSLSRSLFPTHYYLPGRGPSTLGVLCVLVFISIVFMYCFGISESAALYAVSEVISSSGSCSQFPLAEVMRCQKLGVASYKKDNEFWGGGTNFQKKLAALYANDPLDSAVLIDVGGNVGQGVDLMTTGFTKTPAGAKMFFSQGT